MNHKSQTTKKLLFLFAIILIATSCSYRKRITANNIELSSYYATGMVFQKESPIIIKGKCSAFGVLAVKIENAQKYATADEEGYWEVSFPPVDYDGTFSVTVEGVDETIRFDNIAMGQLWAVVGDSWLDDNYENYTEKTEVGLQNNDVRYFQPELDFDKAKTLKGEWKTITREKVHKYEVFCQILGDMIGEKEDEVIGLINLSWPGLSAYDFNKEIQDGQDSLWQRYFEQQIAYKKIADSSYNGINKGVLDRRADDWDWNETEFPVITKRKWYMKNRTVWFRKKIYISEKYIDSDFIVNLGTIRGQFDFYFNGVKIDKFNGESAEYKITIPDSLVKVWTNLITIRMVAGDSLSGLYSLSPYVTNLSSTFHRSMSEEWLYRSYYEQILPDVYRADSLGIPIKENVLDRMDVVNTEGVVFAAGINFFNVKDKSNVNTTLELIEEKVNAKHKYIFLIQKPGVIDSIVNREMYNSIRNRQLEYAAAAKFNVINTLDLEPLEGDIQYQPLIRRLLEVHYK